MLVLTKKIIQGNEDSHQNSKSWKKQKQIHRLLPNDTKFKGEEPGLCIFSSRRNSKICIFPNLTTKLWHKLNNSGDRTTE